MKSLTQKGSTAFVIIITVAVIAILGVVGYAVSNSSTTNKSTTAVKTGSDAPSSINSNADLTQATNALDKTDIDNDVNPNSLDSDLSAVQ